MSRLRSEGTGCRFGQVGAPKRISGLLPAERAGRETQERDRLKPFVVAAVANFAAAALSALSRSRSRRPERRLLQRLLPGAGPDPNAPRENAARSRRRPHQTPAS